MTRSHIPLYRGAEARPVAGADTAVWGRRFASAIGLIWVAGFVISFQVALAILTFMGFFIATVFITRPSVGVLGVGVLCTIDTVARTLLMNAGGLLRYNTFNYFLLIIILLHLPLLLRLQGFQVRLLQLFIVVAAVGLVISPSLKSGLNQLLTLIAPMGLLSYCVSAYGRNNREEVLYWLGIVNGTLGAFGGLVYYVQQSDVPYLNNNAFAYFPLTAIFSICLASVFPKPGRQGFLVFLAAVNLCWVFLSGSRGGLLVAACCSAFLLVQTRGNGRRSVAVAIALLVCLFTSAWFPELETRSQDRIARFTDPTLSYRQRTNGRSLLVTDGWRLFVDHPLGVGTGGFTSARVAAENMSSFRPNHAAHAGWLKILVENGLPGACLCVLFVLSFALVAWQKRTTQVFSFGLFVTLTLCVAYASREFGDSGLWLLSAAAMTLLRAEKVPNRG